MRSLIELAAERLEQLRKAGIEVPDAAAPNPVRGPAPAADEPFARTVALEAAPVLPKQPEPVVVEATPDPEAEITHSIELDLPSLLAKGIVTPGAPQSLMKDQYRVIKRPLIQNAMGLGAAEAEHGNLIMVTSAMAGEGKSFTSINLAMSIAAELDHTVMLVDADVARPSVVKMLGIDQLPDTNGGQLPGLLDVVDGRVPLSEALLKTNVDKLTVLPSGSFHERATELLASDGMRRLLDEISTRYPDRIVIFDSPPLLLTTEARVLATLMGQVVVVVHAEKTGQAVVESALATIESCPNKMLLLNQARTSKSIEYGYGYGYGYGHSQDRPQTGAQRVAGMPVPSTA